MSGFKNELARILKGTDHKDLPGLYKLVSMTAVNEVVDLWSASRLEKAKTACYFSCEYLLGRVIYANLLNLGVLGEFEEAFSEHGLDPGMFEEVEDAALGNGGLGRLAACFLDSAATVGKRLDGYGIRYKYGLFRQSFGEGFQREVADDWQRFGDPWSVRRESERVKVDFADMSVWAVPYDMPVIGYGAKTVNTLRLWQAEALEKLEFDFTRFDSADFKGAFASRNLAEAISCVLYPNDNTDEGRRLRIKQEYFFSSASLQSIIRDYKTKGGKADYSDFAEMYAIQLNDTHPAVAIPELLRLLIACEGLTFEQALPVVKNTFAYTNHTVMAEALEKWDAAMFCAVVPEVYPYIIMLQNHLRQELKGRGITGKDAGKYDIVDKDRRIHMARMSVYASHSTNGVAEIHTGILKDTTLKEWYSLYPERFSNKTNGITQRRWLELCNPEMADFITQKIGGGWITNLDELKGLEAYADDAEALDRFNGIKLQNKKRLAEYVKKHEDGFVLNTLNIFDIQIKRLHEYKRQLLNAFSIVNIYFALKENRLDNFAPTTFLFGAKSAPAYGRAKGIIKYINEIAKLVNNDPDVADSMQVLFVQNYNVSYAEKLIPAADISEQISTAGTEASGTGNMKLMLNGAVTLGTYDGANIEIVAEAGEGNNFIFGARVEDIEKIAKEYNPKRIYLTKPRIRRVVDTLVDGTFSDGGTGVFRELHASLLEGAIWHKPDQYYLLLDLESYIDAKLKANLAYRNRRAFAKKCLLNTANAGKFSSDRTIRQYAEEIWGLQ